MSDEQALIRAAQGGDASAFEQLLEQYYETIYRFAYRWCGNREDAEDVAQQVCLKLAGAIKSFRFDASFSSWLYRVVINCARDWSRNQRRHGESTPAEMLAEPVSESNLTERQAYFWQVLGRLDQLPEGIKETLLLVHAEGMTHSEAARVLAVKESTVSWRLHEFRKQYRLSIDAGGLRD